MVAGFFLSCTDLIRSNMILGLLLEFQAFPSANVCLFCFGFFHHCVHSNSLGGNTKQKYCFNYSMKVVLQANV
jgi:hypothetical protein